VVALYAGELAAWAIDSSLRRPANAAAYRTLFETQLAGRVQLYRTVALPCRDDSTPAPDAAKVYFDFIPKAEQQLMWSAASMTSRSGNLVRTGGANWMPPPLKRYDLKALRFR